MQAEAIRIMAPITVEVELIIEVFGTIFFVGLVGAAVWIILRRAKC